MCRVSGFTANEVERSASQPHQDHKASRELDILGTRTVGEHGTLGLCFRILLRGLVYTGLQVPSFRPSTFRCPHQNQKKCASMKLGRDTLGLGAWGFFSLGAVGLGL